MMLLEHAERYLQHRRPQYTSQGRGAVKLVSGGSGTGRPKPLRRRSRGGRADMRYLITGGTGFIGAYAVRALLEAGHQVTVLDLMPNREFLADVLGVADVLGAPPGD